MGEKPLERVCQGEEKGHFDGTESEVEVVGADEVVCVSCHFSGE